MNFFFEYIWYRVSRVYRKEDKIGITGSGFLAFAQSLAIMILIMRLLKGTLEQDFVSANAKELGYASLLLIFLMIFVNHTLYSKKYDFFDQIYKAESKAKSILKGILVIFSLMFPFIIGALIL